MPNYIVNTTKQYDKDDKLYYEVHQYPQSNCSSPNYPEPENQLSLGRYADCHGALKKAEELGYKVADGCYYCCNDCHSKQPIKFRYRLSH